VEYAEMKDAAKCCGAGGTFSMAYYDIARTINDWKLDNAEKRRVPVFWPPVVRPAGCILPTDWDSAAAACGYYTRPKLLPRRTAWTRRGRNMEQQMLAELKRLVGAQYVMEQLEDRICYSFDATFRDFPPYVVVKPGSVEEIVAMSNWKAVQCAGNSQRRGTVCTAARYGQGGIALVLTGLTGL